ncbi:SET domain-containing protein [Hysterangium stoloniferum]|nr:SET domain-containing protein [Hysterangium stoloniferum]
MQDDDVDPAWDNLVSWLESIDPQLKEGLHVHSKRIPGVGRGLFATKDVPPNTAMFKVPKSAHMNIETLAPLYGVKHGLSATQLISLHLFLHKPDEGRCTTALNFGAYISILPEDFASHPLTWLIKSSSGDHSDAFLLDCLTPAAVRALSQVAGRFQEDRKAVLDFMEHHPDIAFSTRISLSSLNRSILERSILRYLWAWLNVNTRCVYLRLCPSQSDPDNLTLCPVLDLANHTSAAAHATKTTPIPTFFSPPTLTLKGGDEVYLRYGSHSNTTLFTEYGFVEQTCEFGGQADIQDILEIMIQKEGSLGEWIKATLESNNYWGGWTLHDTPSPAHPSYRLLPALRLLNLTSTVSSVLQSDDPFSNSPDLQAWQDTLLGNRDIVSDINEEQTWQQLREICSLAVKRAEEGINKLQETCQRHTITGWRHYARESVMMLWEEERRVAEAVQESIDNAVN